MKRSSARARLRSSKHVDDPRVGRIVDIVRARTAIDLAAYKPSTLERSVARRMRACREPSLERYVGVLAQRPDECVRLARAVHIGVTSFFRDPEAFAALRAPLRERLVASPGHVAVRAWCAACSTGEEAYSLAIVLREILDEIGSSAPLRVFATDIDDRAIAWARAGVYPVSIAAEVGRRRLRRWFVRADSSYEVGPTIRNTVLFAQQDVLREPPFSRLDLVSCRNFLIYLRPEVQAGLLETFRRALRPGALLFLGASETLPHDAGFEDADARWRLFRRSDVAEPASRPGRRAERLRDDREALARAMDDLHNLTDVAETAAIVVGRNLVVRRLTERARHLFGLAAVDVGAPLAELGVRLGRPAVAEDARRVLRTHVAADVEAATDGGRTFAMRIHPYRTAAGEVDGVVVTLVDETRLRALTANEGRLVAALRGSPTSVFVTSADLRVRWASGGVLAETVQLVGRVLHDVLPRADADALAELAAAALASRRAERRLMALTLHGRRTPVHVHVSAAQPDGEPELRWVATEVDP